MQRRREGNNPNSNSLHTEACIFLMRHFLAVNKELSLTKIRDTVSDLTVVSGTGTVMLVSPGTTGLCSQTEGHV